VEDGERRPKKSHSWFKGGDSFDASFLPVSSKPLFKGVGQNAMRVLEFTAGE